MSPAVRNARLEADVAAHYGKGGLTETILAGLEQSGADLDALTPEDLAPVDEFHTAGRITTLRALDLSGVAPASHVLDAGCGIGGTARHLARERGCRVTGIDLTPEYVDTARELTARMGLAESCTFRVGSVLAMPFEDASFDAGLTFHVAMNIEDRARFYSELARVLREGARLCVFDVMKGPTPGMLYPVPWAETAATSFLRSAAETRALLEGAGFAVTAEDNLREFAIAYFRESFANAARSDRPSGLGLHLLTGANAREKFSNYLRAVEAHQIEPVILAARRR
jgi:ubiquinone/menaquinone biosynthesis C-methylase UbiE